MAGSYQQDMEQKAQVPQAERQQLSNQGLVLSSAGGQALLSILW